VQFAAHLTLSGAFLLLSIVVGLIASPTGAPLLLAFLGLGMVFGEDRPVGIRLDNHVAAHVIGSLAVAIIQFDGRLRTISGTSGWPPGRRLLLANLGVVVTSAPTGIAAHAVLKLDWLGSLLIATRRLDRRSRPACR
jgi:cell volume regulation protein A